MSPLERAALAASQGRRLFGVDLKIVDEKGARAAPESGTPGELLVRGPTIVSGYYKNEDASAKQIDREGWFATGDVARIDPGGWLAIVDRTKDLVKSGGEWISSIDVENAALACKGIANCAVVGVRHSKVGRAAAAGGGQGAGRRPEQGGDPGDARPPHRQVADARRRGVRRRAAADGDGQDLQEGPARPVRGLSAAGVTASHCLTRLPESETQSRISGTSYVQ